MKNLTTHTGTLTILERLNNSFNGNPRYKAEVAGFKFYTAPDSMHAYSLPNYEGKLITVTIGTYYGKPTLNTLNTGN